MNLGYELSALYDMNSLELWWYERLGILWAKASRCYEQHRVKDDTNNSWSWAYVFKCYEQLKAVDDMKNFVSWAQGSRCYE